MSIIGSLLTDLLATTAGEALAGTPAGPLDRLAREVRRRITELHVALAWLITIPAMAFGLRLGVGASTIVQLLALCLWIGTPVAALTATGIWWHRRGA